MTSVVPSPASAEPDGLDDLVQLAAQLCAAPAARVLLVGEVEPAAQVGPAGPLPPLYVAHTLGQPGVLQVEDAPDLPDGLRFYAGVRLGQGQGLLAVLDAAPRRLTDAQAAGLLRLGRQAERLLLLRQARQQTQQQTGYAESLGARLRELHAAREQRDFMVVLAAHDLKNPLTAIQANAQFVLGAMGLDAEERDALADIIVAAEQMQQLTIDFLDTSTHERGQLALRPERVDLAALARQVASSLRSEARERGQRIEVAALQEPVITGDESLLRRALVNLVQNALKYGRSSDVVEVRLQVASGEARLEVCDSGPGVPEAERQRIFAPYARLDRDAGTAAGQSRGLGLTFCQLAAEAHGGRVWVADNQPRGAVFCLALPLGPHEAAR